MSEIPEYTNTDKGGSSWQMPAIAILALIALGGLFFGWSNSAKLDAAKQAVTDQVKSVQQTTQQDLTAMKDRIAIDEKTNTDLQGDLKV